MADLGSMGRLLVFAGLAIAALGVLLALGGRIPYLGRLPGDVFVQRGQSRFYFPIVTCIVISVALTLLLNLFARR